MINPPIFYVQADGVPSTQVYPVFEGLFNVEQEDGRIYFREKMESRLFFSRKQDYDLLLPFRFSECAKIALTVRVWADDQYVDYWDGNFTIFGNSIDYDRCVIEISPEPADGYECFEDSLKEVYNGFEFGEAQTVTAVAGDIEQQICEGSELGSNRDVPPGSGCLDDASKWCLKEHFVSVEDDFNPDDEPFEFTRWVTTWHREVIETDCADGAPAAPTIGSGWQLLENNCGASNTATWWRCPDVSGTQILGPYENGRLWSDFLEGFAAALGCGLTVKSDFFNVNPAGDAPENEEYQFAQDNLHNLTIHQKSDIKRKSAGTLSAAPSWNFDADELIEDLSTIFNVWVEIDSNVLIVEHFTFFTRAQEYDFTDVPMVKKVKYGDGQNVRSETFYAMDRNSSEDFAPGVIKYSCGLEAKERPVKLFSFDIGYLEESQNSENVADEGFVLIANDIFEGSLVVRQANTPLSWAVLLPNLHLQNRPYRAGTINGAAAAFDEWQPYIEQEAFKVTFDDLREFEPNSSVTTSIGVGRVSSATKNIYTKKINIKTAY